MAGDVVSIEIDDQDLIDLVNAIPGAEAVLFDEITKVMNKSLIIYKGEVQGETPVNFGTARNSVQNVIEGRSPILNGKTIMGVIYGEPLEHGRKPGKAPPVEAIELWVIRKGIAEPGPESRQVAYVIARAIGRGTSRLQKAGGARMFEKAFKNVTPRVIQLWEKMVGDVTNQMDRYIDSKVH